MDETSIDVRWLSWLKRRTFTARCANCCAPASSTPPANSSAPRAGARSTCRVAKEVGVSRPVLYKEIGTRQDLADAVIAAELDTFLAGITETIAAHPRDVLAALTAA